MIIAVIIILALLFIGLMIIDYAITLEKELDSEIEDRLRCQEQAQIYKEKYEKLYDLVHKEEIT